MKACLLLQRRFAYVGHNLALLLKEHYGIDEFCGYVYVRRSYEFLMSQKEIHYSSLLLDQEIHGRYSSERIDTHFLQSLEAEYGIPNLWPYVSLDRALMHNRHVREYPYDKSHYSHDDLLRILQVTAKAIIKFLDDEKPDFIFFSVIGAVGGKLLYHIAKKRGIATYVVHPTMIHDNYVLSETYNGLTGVENKVQLFSKESAPEKVLKQAQNFLNDFRHQPRPHYEFADKKYHQTTKSKQLSFVLPTNALKIMRWFFVSLKHHATGRERHDYDYISPINYVKDGIRRKLRNLRGVDDLYDEPGENDNFTFFPLHYEPEVSLLLYAPFFADQIHLIKQIAMSLPVNHYLYVKEHPTMVPYRPRNYYKAIKKIHNVKLINPNISSFDLIARSKLIMTITSSVGWEATLLKKPVITFGDIFYNQLSFVKHCKTPENIPYLVKEQLENFRYDENELLNLLAAIFSESAHLNLQYLWEREKDLMKRKEGLKPLADLLAQKLHLTNKQLQ